MLLVVIAIDRIDTAKTDAFFKRHEILETPDAENLLSKQPHYASKYQLYIHPIEVLHFMRDTLVNRLVDLEPGQRTVTSLGRGKPRAHGYRPFAGYRTGQWLLGRNTGPEPQKLRD